MTVTDVQSILEFGSKINGLMRWARGSGATDLETLRGLARASGIPYATLQSSLKVERISIANQNRIAEVFGFGIDWPEWRGSADCFLEKFRTLKSANPPLTIEARLTSTHLDRRTADFAFGVAGTFDAVSEEGIRLVVSLSFDQRGWPVFHDLTVAIREVDLQLFCNREGGEFEIFALTCSGEAEGNFCSAAMGTGKGYAYWTIKSVDSGGAFIAGTRRRNDGQDCIFRGFREGDEIRALMTARKIQCFGTIAGKSLEKSTAIKRRFIEHLTKLAVLNGNESTLAEQVLKVVQKP